MEEVSTQHSDDKSRQPTGGINFADAAMNPLRLHNISVTINEPLDLSRESFGVGLELDIIGFSEASAGDVSIDGLRPEAAQELLFSFIESVKAHEEDRLFDPSVDQGQKHVPYQAVRDLLLSAEAMGARIHSEELGVFPGMIAHGYRELVETVRKSEPTKIEFLEKKIDKPESWDVFKRQLEKNVSDEAVLVWVKAEVPKGSGAAEGQRIEWIREKHLMNAGSALRKVVEGVWELGQTFQLPVVSNLPKDHFNVSTSKVQILMKQGFVMTIVESGWQCAPDLYTRLNQKKVDNVAMFMLEAINFCLEKNAKLLENLKKVQDAIKLELDNEDPGKIKKFLDLTYDLNKSAIEAGHASDNYITALNNLPDNLFKPDELNIKGRALEYAKEYVETAAALVSQTEKLYDIARAQQQEKIATYISKVGVLGFTTLFLSTGIAMPSIWKEYTNVPNLIYLGILLGGTYLLSKFALRPFNDNK